MKKRIFSLLLAVVLVLGMLPVPSFAAEEDYELKILDFEGDYWDALIDDPQQMGPLLYGEEGTNNGYSSEEKAYQWTDEDTKLHHVLPYNWGTYCYVGGGHGISNYATANYAEYGNYMYQLTVYDAEAGNEIARSGGGHNGSDNFVMHFGYIDGSPYNQTESLPTLSFADGVARVVDHMYVNMSAYTLSCLLSGNDLTAPGGTFWVKAIGFNGEKRTGEVVMALSDGENSMVTDWTKWELSGLGEVTAVQFNVGGSADNGYGFSQPAYFAYDDVAVRFPVESACDHKDTEVTTTYERVTDTETHTLTMTCECGTEIFSSVDPCVDEGKDGACDLCGGVVCLHPETETVWVQMENQKEHLYYTRCAVCEKRLSTDSYGNCEDTDADGNCDGCGYPVSTNTCDHAEKPRNKYTRIEGKNQHTHQQICKLCDAVLEESIADCVDTKNGADGVCDKCKEPMLASCDHAETTTSYERVADTETHTVTVKCANEACGQQIGETTIAECEDDDKNGECDLCKGTVVVPCEHTETTPSYAQVEGSETHTVTVKCANAECGETIDEPTIELCVDEGKDGQCDLCKGAVKVETPEAPAAGPWDGTTLTEPAQVDGVYQIGSGAELAWFAKTAAANSKAVLTADIDLNNQTWTAMSKLSGSFDGQNHTIKGLKGSQGLFVTVAGSSDSARAEVKNVTVEGTIFGAATKTGAFAGTAYYANFTGCINKADVTGTANYIAGIVGFAQKDTNGGYVTLQNCGNEGKITSSASAAGVLGFGKGSTVVSDCYNTGAISGYASSNNATQNGGVGGIVGGMQGYKNACSINNSYNTGAVDGKGGYAGGIIGSMYNNVSMTNCYNAGTVTGGSGKVGAVAYFVHKTNTGATNCYYLDASCATDVATRNNTGFKPTVKTEAEMKSADFVTALGVSYQANGGDYPVLVWQTVTAGSETYMVTAPTTAGITFGGLETAFSTEAYTFTVTVDDYYRATEAFAVKVNGEALEAASVEGKVYTYTIEAPASDLVVTVEGVESTETVIWSGSNQPSQTAYISNIKIYDVTVTEIAANGRDITVTLAEDTDLSAPIRFTAATGGAGAYSLSVIPGLDFVKELGGGRLQQTIKATENGSGMSAEWNVTIQVAGLAEAETVEVTKPIDGRFTITGEDTAIVGGNYAFSLKLNSRYLASDTFAVKANGNVLTAVNGEYIVENVTEPIEITVEGIAMKTFAEIEAVGKAETKIITSDEEGILQGLYAVSMGEWGTSNKTYYNNVPYYHVTVPYGTTQVKITYPNYFQNFPSGAINGYQNPWGCSPVTVQSGIPKDGGISTGDNMESYKDEQGRPYVLVNIKNYTMEKGGNGNGFTLQGGTLGWADVFTFEVAPCDHGGETYYKYEQIANAVEGQYSHTVSVCCSICDAVIDKEEDANCVDNDGSDTCDKCEGLLDCHHKNTTTTGTLVTGWEKHTVKVTCDLCKEQIGEIVTEACTDADADGICDVCKGDVALNGTTVIYSGTGWPYSGYYIAKLKLSGADVLYTEGTTVYLEADTAKDAELSFEAVAGGSSSGNLGIHWNDGADNTKTYTTSLVDGTATVKVYAYKASGSGVSRDGTKTFTIKIHECVDADSNSICDLCGAALEVESERSFLSISADGVQISEDKIHNKGIFSMGDLETDERDTWEYVHEVPHFHVEVPCGAASVDVTYSEDVNIFHSESTAYGYTTDVDGVDAVSSATVHGYTFTDAYTKNEDGTQTVKTPVIGFVLDEEGKGRGITLESEGGMYDAVTLFTFSYDGSHGVTDTDYEQVEGQEQHTVTVKCACGETVGEVTTAPCVDDDKDGKCDNCGGEVAPAETQKGDVDGESGITAKDATVVLQWIAAGADYVPQADMDNDGKITAKDATIILRLVASDLINDVEE